MFITYIKIVISFVHFIAGMRVERRDYGMTNELNTCRIISNAAVRRVVTFLAGLVVLWVVYSVGTMIYKMQDNIGAMRTDYALLKSNFDSAAALTGVYRDRSEKLLQENDKLEGDLRQTTDLVLKLDGKYQNLESELRRLEREYKYALAREARLQKKIEEDTRRREDFRLKALQAMMEINRRIDT